MLLPEIRRQIRDTTLDIKIEQLEIVLEDIVDRILAEKQAIMDEEKPLLTIDDLAKRFQITKATIHNWLKRGTIKGSKVGKNRYFTEDEVRSALGNYGWSKHTVNIRGFSLPEFEIKLVLVASYWYVKFNKSFVKKVPSVRLNVPCYRLGTYINQTITYLSNLKFELSLVNDIRL